MGNVNSLPNKLVELMALCRTEQRYWEASWSVFSEMWLTGDVPDANVGLTGLSSFAAGEGPVTVEDLLHRPLQGAMDPLQFACQDKVGVDDAVLYLLHRILSYLDAGGCSPLPLSALKLLVPPIRFVSAAIWKTIQQKVVADYGMLEEFVSMVTDILPELLTTHQRTQLILGLRGRLILELCQFDGTANFDLVQSYLERMQMFFDAWVEEVGAASMKAPQSEFVDLVKKMLNCPDEREHFFQNIFPVEFGSTYDEALHTLMWMFLSRLERFLPLQSFQQVSTMLGEESSVLEEFMMIQHEDLKTLLRYQKELNQLDHNGKSA
ncbi:uncharacterized protein [Antennarius striatus]|uniref:uncharacterized protein n=1 Tax=Antennarius striatus TaxID=241820 RepID=UPI0035AE5A88